jgi:hypothetical protein
VRLRDLMEAAIERGVALTADDLLKAQGQGPMPPPDVAIF